MNEVNFNIHINDYKQYFAYFVLNNKAKLFYFREG